MPFIFSPSKLPDRGGTRKGNSVAHESISNRFRLCRTRGANKLFLEFRTDHLSVQGFFEDRAASP
ncbi:MAG: hypothetical protein BRC52_15125 [Cyanobacteria bacterium SW_5_48_44]|nr:MAG: hypothetical protein BRC52_15125 [Cyanobacteria bacterium SW_5_48_44]